MMSNNRLMMNSNAMSPTTDVDFAFAPMPPQPYLGFDAGMSSMPSVERPLLQQQHDLLYDNNLDFPSSSFPFQDPSSLLPPTTSLPLVPPMPSMAMAMTALSSLQMPPTLMTLPGLPTAELYHPFGGGPSSSLLKREDGPIGGGRIGLNLGRRTYFSPADVLAVDRLLNRSRPGGGRGMGLGTMGLGMAGVLGLGLGAVHHHHQPPRCQAEGCKADLSAAKHYHRRHKVCEYHAKAAAVAAGGKQQRFCQQCSRFHVLADFDDSKRSCRKRLTEHNRRRRKPANSQGKDSSPSPPPPKKAGTTSITTSYNSDHKGASTAAAKSTAISPNGSGVSCLLDMDNGQTSSATPTALSLAALPLPEKDGGLDTMLMQQVHGHHNGDDNVEGQHFMTSLVLQAQEQHHNGGSSHVVDGGNILSCSSVSDHQQNGGCNGFFEVDFI